MRMQAAQLRDFYASPLGKAARRMIVRRLTALWPNARGLDVLGLGYATPFLSPYSATARSISAAMPAAQGAEHWPAQTCRRALVCAEDRLPFRADQFDRVIAAHLLEEADNLADVTGEIARVIAPAGRIVFVTANRRGMWSRSDKTPFGHGRPFSKAQLNQVLRHAGLEPVAWARAVYTPPLNASFMIRTARSVERVGERLTPRWGGVLMIEAVKRVAKPVGGATIIRPVFGSARPQGVVAAPRTHARTGRSQ